MKTKGCCIPIPARRKFYCKRGITDILINKGEYLLKEKKRLFLARDEKKEEIVFVKINYDALLTGWKLNGYLKDKLWVISFNLDEEQISQAVGKKIQGILEKLYKSGIRFRLSKPLPPCIFENSMTMIKKYHIPLNCKDCLELLIVSKGGEDNLFCGFKMDAFLFYKGGRYQLIELLKNLNGTSGLERCVVCEREEECKFWLWTSSCYNKRNIWETPKRKAINGWKDDKRQKWLMPWWFLQHKWEVNPDISMWQRLSKYRLKNEWIIDAGGAHGRNSFALYKISKKTVLVDAGEGFFRYTRERQERKQIPFPIINADIGELPFKNDSVGMIYSGGVLHSMPEREKRKHLKECYRVLKPAGLFTGVVMAEWELGRPPALWQVTHKKELVDLLKRAGFNLVYILAKIRIKNEPQQFWQFLSVKIKKVKSPDFLLLNNNFRLGSNCLVTPLFYKRKLLALYHLQKKKYYMLNTLAIKLWRLLERGDAEGIISYLGRKNKKARDDIDEELENLVKEGFVDLYGR